MIRCLFIQGMTDYWLQRQPWKIVQRNWLSPTGWCDFLLRSCSFLGTICSGNEERWLSCRGRWTAMGAEAWSSRSRRGTGTACLGACPCPPAGPIILGALPPAFLQNLGEGLAGSGGKLLPQEVLCARSPSGAGLLCPSRGHPDSVNTWSWHLGRKHTLHPPPCELALVGLQWVHSWSRRRIQLQMPQQWDIPLTSVQFSWGRKHQWRPTLKITGRPGQGPRRQSLLGLPESGQALAGLWARSRHCSVQSCFQTPQAGCTESVLGLPSLPPEPSPALLTLPLACSRELVRIVAE